MEWAAGRSGRRAITSTVEVRFETRVVTRFWKNLAETEGKPFGSRV